MNTSEEIEETLHKATVGGMLASDSQKLPALKRLDKTRIEALGTYLILQTKTAPEEQIGTIIARVLKAAYYLRK